ncbi:MAG: DNA damage-inducible protein D [Candidatus Magasanikbacteria bacterium]
MEKNIITHLHKTFEDCVHIEDDIEFWLARELQVLLGYERWENFENAIKRAKIACTNAKNDVLDHFRGVTKMVDVGSRTTREIEDIKLTRYACYLIAQNGDPRKDEIAFAMTYFAVQTRKQEIIEQRLAQWDRLHAREKLSISEKGLSGILFERGVDNVGFARIRSKGDAALFGGYTTSEMKNKLRVPVSRPLADFLPSVTIKAKDLATEITSHNVKKDQSLNGEPIITDEHIKNNQNMRDMLVKSGIYPESLPPEEDVKKMERKIKSADKKLVKNVKKLIRE